MGLPDGPLKAEMQKLDASAANMSPDEWIAALGKIPLDAAPGALWQYNVSSEIMAVLIARVSGVPFDKFLQTRIFGPLKMKDTGFYVPADKRDRLVEAYAPGPDGKLHPISLPRFALVSPPKRPSGAGGLVSTPDDYLRFARMLLNGGELEGVRILKAATVAEMTRNHLTPEQRAIQPREAVATTRNMWEDRGFGYGVSVQTIDQPDYFSTGGYGWPGAFGTQWTNDPKNKVIVLYFIQRLGEGTPGAKLFREWLGLTYKHLHLSRP